jgi:hypothetical protein
VEAAAELAHRAEKWTRFSALGDALFSKGEHRAEKWTRFSAPNDALF